jgi:hypothetical protein
MTEDRYLWQTHVNMIKANSHLHGCAPTVSCRFKSGWSHFHLNYTVRPSCIHTYPTVLRPDRFESDFPRSRSDTVGTR